jgi:hypothetical protein
MTIYQLLQAYKAVMQTMDDNGYSMRGLRDVNVYEDYQRLLAEGGKKTYAWNAIKDKYGISDGTLFSIIKRMDTEASV